MCVNTYNVTVPFKVVSSYYTPAHNGAGTGRPLSCGTSNLTCNGDKQNKSVNLYIAFYTKGREYSVNVGSEEHLGASRAPGRGTPS